MHFVLQYTQPWCCVLKLPAVIFWHPCFVGFVCRISEESFTETKKQKNHFVPVGFFFRSCAFYLFMCKKIKNDIFKMPVLYLPQKFGAKGK